MNGSNNDRLLPACSKSTTNSTSPIKTMDKAEIMKLALISWNGPVQVLETTEEMQRAVALVLNTTNANNSTHILGFDTETRP